MLDLAYRHADQVMKSPQGHALYIGDACAAEDVTWLKQYGVRTVITAATGFHFSYDSTIKHIKYELQDKKSENASVCFDMAAFQINKYLKTSGVLVHCGAGVSRSPTLVIAYLIKYKDMSFLYALRFLKSKRPQVCPNLGFELQLKAYEKSHQTTGNPMLFTMKKKEKKQLPEIVKYQPLATYNKSFHRESEGRVGNITLSKSLKPVEKKEKSELEYLRKMAEFRFGITNMSRWKISNPLGDDLKKQENL